MPFIIRQDKDLFKRSGINIEFDPNTLEAFYSNGNESHLKQFFGQSDWEAGAPIEVHPYLRKYPISPTYDKLLIGTMPPVSYINHAEHPAHVTVPSLGKAPNMYYYYGNRGLCWDFFVDRKATRLDIEKFVQQNSISISDTVKVCQRKPNLKFLPLTKTGKRGRQSNAYSPADTDLYNILLNEEIIGLLLSSSSQIKNLYFTSTRLKNVKIGKDGLAELNAQDFGAFSSFLAIPLLMKIPVEIAPLTSGKSAYVRLNNSTQKHVRSKFGDDIVFKIRLGEHHEFNVICLPSPASSLGVARQYLFKKWLKYYSLVGYRKFLYGVSLENIMNSHSEIPSFDGFAQAWDSYKRDIYQMSLSSKGLEKLAVIQSQEVAR